MIYFNICGNKGAGTAESVQRLILLLLNEPDTKQVILIDETAAIKSPVTEYRLVTVESNSKLIRTLDSNYDERFVMIVPNETVNIDKCIEKCMKMVYEVDINNKIYCIKRTWSI